MRAWLLRLTQKPPAERSAAFRFFSAMNNETRPWLLRHKRFGIILAGIITLDCVYGFDARFTLVNLLWIFISLVKID